MEHKCDTMVSNMNASLLAASSRREWHNEGDLMVCPESPEQGSRRSSLWRLTARRAFDARMEGPVESRTLA
eukprot:752504-Hanusia_phi.AAC.1